MGFLRLYGRVLRLLAADRAVAIGLALAALAIAGGPAAADEGPASLAELGRSTWTLLHTMAAYYPERDAPQRRVLQNLPRSRHRWHAAMANTAPIAIPVALRVRRDWAMHRPGVCALRQD